MGSAGSIIAQPALTAESDVARLEWIYLAVLEHSDRPATRLGGLLATDPAFFVEVLSLVYRAEGQPPRVLGPDEERMAAQASVASETLDEGFANEAMNSRGVVWRGRGGDQERELAAAYGATATALRDAWPRTAAIFDALAASYLREAAHWDVQEAIDADDAAYRAGRGSSMP